MKGKTFLTVAGLLFLALVLATLPFMGACAPEEAPPEEAPPEEAPPEEFPPAPPTIKIGALISITGPDASVGGQQLDGYQMAVDDINEDGGVYVKEFDKKIPLELIVMDMETNAEKAAARAETLYAEHDVVASVGSMLVGAAAHIFEKNKLPVIVMANAISALHDRDYKYWFSACPKNPDFVQAVLNFLDSIPEDIRPTKVAIFEEQTDWVLEYTIYFKKEAAARGYDIVSYGKYAMLAKDLSPLILEAKDAGGEVVIGNPTTPDAITLLKQMKELDYNSKAVVIMRAAGDISWASAAGEMGEYVISPDEWHPALDFPGVDELNAKYQAKSGQPAQPHTGPSYASIQILADAIERAGTLDRDKIRDAIAATDMITVGGPVKFAENGTLIEPTVLMSQWQSGVKEIIWPEKWMTKPLVYPLPEWSKR
jgi:branched-chain amino acid transport system substrate-binding protein